VVSFWHIKSFKKIPGKTLMAQIQMGQKIGPMDFVKFGPYVDPIYTCQIVIVGESALDYFGIPCFHLA
jgi:hypothetical protein